MSFVVAELHINKRADGATTSIKAKPNVRNISTQHLTTLLDRVEGCCEEAGQTRATSCNIDNVVTLQKLDPTPSNILHIFQQGGRVPNVCNVVIYKTEKNWWRRLRSSAALSSHLTTLHTTMHIISKSQYALTMVQLNIFVLIHQTIKFQTKLINGTRKAN